MRTGLDTVGGSERVIEEIVVTAQKTQESLQDVPISVSALPGEFMKDNAIGDLVEVSLSSNTLVRHKSSEISTHYSAPEIMTSQRSSR